MKEILYLITPLVVLFIGTLAVVFLFQGSPNLYTKLSTYTHYLVNKEIAKVECKDLKYDQKVQQSNAYWRKPDAPILGTLVLFP